MAIRKFLPQIAMLGFGLLVGLVLSEVVLRRFVPLESVVYQIDEYVLYKFVPGTEKTFVRLEQNGGERIEVSINSLGYRGKELVNSPDEIQVVVYGDSFIEGEFSPLEETFASRLQQELQPACGLPVEVVNAGVIGYGPDQVNRRIERELDGLHPDLVVVAVFADNDFGDLIRNKIYRLGPDGQLQDNAFVFSERVRDDLKPGDTLALIRTMKKTYWRMLDMARNNDPTAETPGTHKTDPDVYIGSALSDSRDEYANYIAQGDNEIKQLAYDHYDADIALDPESESAHYKLSLMEQVLKRLHLNMLSRSTPLVLLIIPSPIDVVEGYYWQVEEGAYPGYDRRKLSGAVVEIAERNNIDYYDLFDLFLNNNPASLYFSYGDNHWNGAGQALAAESMKEHLVRSSLLTGCQ